MPSAERAQEERDRGVLAGGGVDRLGEQAIGLGVLAERIERDAEPRQRRDSLGRFVAEQLDGTLEQAAPRDEVAAEDGASPGGDQSGATGGCKLAILLAELRAVAGACSRW